MKSKLRNYLKKQAQREPPTLTSRGLSWAVKRFRAIKPHLFYQVHCFVYGFEDWAALTIPEPQHGGRHRRSTLIDLEYKEIKKPDKAEIEGLISVDEWNIQEAEITSRLEEGWVCYAAKHQGTVVGCLWAFVGNEIKEPHFGRTFSLSPHEAYYWRGSCTRDFRGKGVITSLTFHLTGNLARTYGKTSGVAITKVRNKPMLRAYGKMHWQKLGRTGLVEIMGIRIVYILGKDAFRATRKRIRVGFWTAGQLAD